MLVSVPDSLFFCCVFWRPTKSSSEPFDIFRLKVVNLTATEIAGRRYWQHACNQPATIWGNIFEGGWEAGKKLIGGGFCLYVTVVAVRFGGHGKNESKKKRIKSERDFLKPRKLRVHWSVDCSTLLKAYFHYGCALRCVARDIETLIVFLFLSPRNATRSPSGNTALLLRTWEDRHRELCSSRLSGLSSGAFIKSNRLNRIARL